MSPTKTMKKLLRDESLRNLIILVENFCLLFNGHFLEIALLSPYLNLNIQMKATATNKGNGRCRSRSRCRILKSLIFSEHLLK